MKHKHIIDTLRSSFTDYNNADSTINVALSLLSLDSAWHRIVVMNSEGCVYWNSPSVHADMNLPHEENTCSLDEYVHEFKDITVYTAVVNEAITKGTYEAEVTIGDECLALKAHMKLIFADNYMIAAFRDSDQKEENENVHVEPNTVKTYEDLEISIARNLIPFETDETLYLVVLTVRNVEDLVFLRGQGHVDKIFEAYAKVLRPRLSERIEFFQLSFEELAILIPSKFSLKDVMLRLQHLMNLMEFKVNVDGQSYHLQVHGGISVMSTTLTVDGLIKNARFAKDLALSQNTLLESYSVDELVRHIETITMADRFLTALYTDKLHMEYQPIVTRNHATWAYEALIRWRDGHYGDISAQKIIEYAERSGTMIRLGYWIIRRVFKEYVEILSKINPECVVTINLSLEQFKDNNLADTIYTLALEYGIDPQRVMFEITESQAYEKLNDVIRYLKVLSDYGFLVALDDFGVGYSTIQSLLELPINVLKLDRSLITGISGKKRNIAVCKHVVSLAKELGLYVVAEGIESVEDEAVVRENAVELYQGYYYSKPQRAESLVKIPLL